MSDGVVGDEAQLGHLAYFNARGPLAAPIAVLLWLYLVAIAVLIGAAVNAAFDTVFLGGEILVRHGKYTFIDEEEVLAKAAPVIRGLNQKIKNL